MLLFERKGYEKGHDLWCTCRNLPLHVLLPDQIRRCIIATTEAVNSLSPKCKGMRPWFIRYPVNGQKSGKMKTMINRIARVSKPPTLI